MTPARHPWFPGIKNAAYVLIYRVLTTTEGSPMSRKISGRVSLDDPEIQNDETLAETYGPGRYRVMPFTTGNKLAGKAYLTEIPDPVTGKVPTTDPDAPGAASGGGGDERPLTVRDFMAVQAEAFRQVLAIQAESLKGVRDDRKADLAMFSGVVEQVLKVVKTGADDDAQKEQRKEVKQLRDRLLETEKKLARKEGDWSQVMQIGGTLLDKLKPPAPPNGAANGHAVKTPAADAPAAGDAPDDPPPPEYFAQFFAGGGALTHKNISDLADRLAAGTLSREHQLVIVPHVLARYRAGQLPDALAAKLRPLVEASGVAGAPS